MKEQKNVALDKIYRTAYVFVARWLSLKDTYKGDFFNDCAADAVRESTQFQDSELKLFSGIIAANLEYIEKKASNRKS